MNPSATLERLYKAWYENDFAGVRSASSELLEWLGSGGCGAVDWVDLGPLLCIALQSAIGEADPYHPRPSAIAYWRRSRHSRSGTRG